MTFDISQGLAQTCIPPTRPYSPNNAEIAREYADILRQDFETYLQNVQRFFLCLDQARVEMVGITNEVIEDYQRFLEIVGD